MEDIVVFRFRFDEGRLPTEEVLEQMFFPEFVSAEFEDNEIEIRISVSQGEEYPDVVTRVCNFMIDLYPSALLIA